MEKSTASSAADASRTVLLVTHVVPYPPSAGNEIRILKLIAWLRDEGWTVVLLLRSHELPPPVMRALEERVDRLVLLPRAAPDPVPASSVTGATGIRSALSWRLERLRPKGATFPALAQWMIGPRSRRRPTLHEDEPAPTGAMRWLCPPELVETARELCKAHRPRAVIVEYIFLSACLEVAPPHALRLIDTIDMFSQKQNGVIRHGVEDALACTPQQERRHLLKADVIVAIQAREAALMAQLVPEREVINVGIDFDVVAPAEPRPRVRGRILVVGSSNPLNMHGLRSFLDEAWPSIARRCERATLRIVGNIGKAVGDAIERVELAGWVESLAAEYDAADVVINPIVAGTGLKIKTVEALCHGKAVVTSPSGVEGLPAADPPPFATAESWPSFADAVVALLTDAAAREDLERAAMSYAASCFDRERVYAPLKHALNDRRPAVKSP